MATRATIRTEIKNLLGKPLILADVEVDTSIQTAHSDILGDWSWPQQRARVSLTTLAEVAGTDAGLTQGSATVTTADAAAAWVGRQIRFGGSRSYYTITNAAVGVDITLDAAWPGADADPVAFTVFRLVYALPADAEQVQSVDYRYPLDEVTQEAISDIDPERWDTSSEPTAWAYAGRDSAGALLIEIWERPPGSITLMVSYLKSSVIDDDADIPVVPANLVTWRGAANAAMLLAGKTTDDAGAWLNMAQLFEQRYQSQFQSARIQAARRFGTARRIRDAHARSSLAGTDFGVARNLRRL